MTDKFDVIIIGSGPGGYVAAIRASQLAMKVALIEKDAVGGVCLNRGCIPTKSLLKSAQVMDQIAHAESYGIMVSDAAPDLGKMIDRSHRIVGEMGQGVQSLLRKNKVTIIQGAARIGEDHGVVVVDKAGKEKSFTADTIVIATGGRPRELENLPIDGKNVINSTQALALRQKPASMVIVGAGAIGVEFADIFNKIGTAVTLVEYDQHLVPLEDQDVSRQLEKSFVKAGVTVLTGSEVVDVTPQKGGVSVAVKSGDGMQNISCDMVLSAVGMTANIENIGLENLGVTTEKGKIIVDSFYQTSAKGIYAIGDVLPGPALAHVASAEGIICIENIAGLNPAPLDYDNIPSCIYSQPEIASVGLTEKAALAAGYEIKKGVFPLSASGKARSAGAIEGFVKVIYDAKYGELLGAHMIGAGVTENIAGLVTAKKCETTWQEIIHSVHPHPTISEAIQEATAAVIGQAIHI